jgi:diaminohydroxyphosphoribosylaminopyrimidine deaminase / 5-amino-6-(5-phosphoribosylamino)uracil reductase
LKWQEADYSFMSRALQLAELGKNSTHPNPKVGCVIVSENKIIGEGWHQFSGGPHAEINALDALTGPLSDASCYVSLEPCNHSGRTGPCTQALIDAGVNRVIAAMPDPNPLVAGQGLARLEAAGIDTRVGLMQDEACKLNPGFIMRMTEKRPYIRCKLAMSLDGKTAMASGESKWITEAAARQDVQALRAGSAAIMTGIGSVLADDPGLNVRDIDIGEREVLRVVLDRQLRMPVKAKMSGLPGRTLVFTLSKDDGRKDKIVGGGAEVIILEHAEIFLKNVLQYLAEHEEVNEILLEAGEKLSGAMLEQGLIDEVILYQAPILMGDAGKGLFYLPSIMKMEDRVKLELLDSCMIGHDRRMTFKVNKKQTND